MSTPRISFLVPDVASPTVGAAIRLAECMGPHFETEIVGPDFGHGVCSMYRHAADFRVVPCPRLYRFPDYFWESRALAEAVTGDVIVAAKAFASTVPIALRERRRRGAKVIVYLDEWDGALYQQLSRWEKSVSWLKNIHHPLEENYNPWVERLIPQADHVISTTTFLQQRFGGSIVPLGVDCDVFRPQPSEIVVARKKELGLSDHRLLVFGGVVRPHKGVEGVLDALCLIGDPNTGLLVVGPRTDYLQSLMDCPKYAPFVHCVGAPSGDKSTVNEDVHDHMPEYLATGDILLVPLADTLLAQSQMPCKVFEAMAMAKPIIATSVSDLPLVLEACGWVVSPGDPQVMADTIRYVLQNPEEGLQKGLAAREKCQKRYSKQETERMLVEIISHVLEK